MDRNKEVGNCRLCDASMTVHHKRCPQCGAERDDCFASKFQQKENIKAVRSQIIKNIKTAFKERRW